MQLPLGIEDQIVAAIRRIMRAVDLHSRHLVEKHGLTGPQLAALHEANRMGKVSTGALARAVHLSQPTLTGILDRLERRGLIERSRDSKDRRTVNVALNSAGQRVLFNAPSLLQDRFRRELSKLEQWEQTQMLATLQRIATMMDADIIEASPILVTGPIDTSTEVSQNTVTAAEPPSQAAEYKSIPKPTTANNYTQG